MKEDEATREDLFNLPVADDWEEFECEAIAILLTDKIHPDSKYHCMDFVPIINGKLTKRISHTYDILSTQGNWRFEYDKQWDCLIAFLNGKRAFKVKAIPISDFELWEANATITDERVYRVDRLNI